MSFGDTLQQLEEDPRSSAERLTALLQLARSEGVAVSLPSGFRELFSPRPTGITDPIEEAREVFRQVENLEQQGKSIPDTSQAGKDRAIVSCLQQFVADEILARGHRLADIAETGSDSFKGFLLAALRASPSGSVRSAAMMGLLPFVESVTSREEAERFREALQDACVAYDANEGDVAKRSFRDTQLDYKCLHLEALHLSSLLGALNESFPDIFKSTISRLSQSRSYMEKFIVSKAIGRSFDEVTEESLEKVFRVVRGITFGDKGVKSITDMVRHLEESLSDFSEGDAEVALRVIGQKLKQGTASERLLSVLMVEVLAVNHSETLTSLAPAVYGAMTEYASLLLDAPSLRFVVTGGTSVLVDLGFDQQKTFDLALSHAELFHPNEYFKGPLAHLADRSPQRIDAVFGELEKHLVDKNEDAVRYLLGELIQVTPDWSGHDATIQKCLCSESSIAFMALTLISRGGPRFKAHLETVRTLSTGVEPFRDLIFQRLARLNDEQYREMFLRNHWVALEVMRVNEQMVGFGATKEAAILEVSMPSKIEASATFALQRIGEAPKAVMATVQRFWERVRGKFPEIDSLEAELNTPDVGLSRLNLAKTLIPLATAAFELSPIESEAARISGAMVEHPSAIIRLKAAEGLFDVRSSEIVRRVAEPLLNDACPEVIRAAVFALYKNPETISLVKEMVIAETPLLSKFAIEARRENGRYLVYSR